jgi:hypothetical protein
MEGINSNKENSQISILGIRSSRVQKYNQGTTFNQIKKKGFTG